MFKFKQCTNCGSKNKKHHEHCMKCGSALDNVLKTGTKSLAAVLAILLLLGGATAYAGYNIYYLKNNKPAIQTPTQENKTDTSNNQAPKTITQPTTLPATTIPQATTTPKAVIPAPKSAPTPITTPTPAPIPSTPQPTKEECLASLQATTQGYQDGWDNHYATALAVLNQQLEQVRATYSATGLGNSSFEQSAELAFTHPFDQKMDSDFAEYQRQLKDATQNSFCGSGDLTRQ